MYLEKRLLKGYNLTFLTTAALNSATPLAIFRKLDGMQEIERLSFILGAVPTIWKIYTKPKKNNVKSYFSFEMNLINSFNCIICFLQILQQNNDLNFTHSKSNLQPTLTSAPSIEYTKAIITQTYSPKKKPQIVLTNNFDTSVNIV